MKMKYAVGVMIVVFVVFMGSVFVYGFAQKQMLEDTPPITPSTNTNSDQSSSVAPATQAFTSAQVASHSKPSDCWIIIEAKVYDVGKFLDQHPGGADLILPFCGKDATQAYVTQGGRRSSHSQNARAILEQYKVGTLQ